MNGYSKIKIIGTAASRSRSMDLSDLLSSSSFPQQTPRKSISKKSITTTQNPETNHKNPDIPQQEDSFPEQESNFGSGLKLSRTTSVSSASVAVQSAVKRAFSMKRSSSVSERYRRIHDQSVTLASDSIEDDNEAGTEATRSLKKKHGKRKILKACKRFLGL